MRQEVYSKGKEMRNEMSENDLWFLKRKTRVVEMATIRRNFATIFGLKN